MMIHDITAKAGKNKKRKRVGRGEGSGHGKQSGRGNKGASSRSGHATKRSFEGGQMPLFRRLAKFGFTNAAFRTPFWIVNLSDILDHPKFAKGGAITGESLMAAGLVRDDSRDVKILGDVGEDGVRVKLDIKVARVSASVRKLVLDAGGQVSELGTRRDRVRGIDRNAEDKSPKNLTKKLKRGSKSGKGKKPAAAAAAAEPAADAKDAKPDAKADKKADKKAPDAKA
jgi:large subunit ribosomal protein L15